MSFVNRRIENRPETGEAPFQFNEIFFSRTDDRGVILSGNYVFQRVAHYQWDELLGRPHKIVRHPDMPRGVFWKIWDELKSGRTIGGYVKNLSKDGLHYWVYAVMVPFGDGYLSVRIKPSSDMLQTVKTLYAELLHEENTNNLPPEDSANLMREKILALGFDSYEHFASYSLSEELMSRDAKLGKPEDREVADFRKMIDLAQELTQQTELLISEFEAMRTIPHNLRVIASRLEPTGGPVSTLSQNYGTMSREMSQWFETHVLGETSNFLTIKGSVLRALDLAGMARILAESEAQLADERRNLGGVNLGDERALLQKIVLSYRQKYKSCFNEVVHEADRITKACEVMNRHIIGLSTTRVMCKIESARLPDAGDALNDIITQLMTFQERIKAQLERIGRLSNEIQQARR